MEILLDLPIPTDTKSRLSSRLDTLISIWTPVLQNVSSELRWGWDSEGGLLYIPEGSSKSLQNFRGGRDEVNVALITFL